MCLKVIKSLIQRKSEAGNSFFSLIRQRLVLECLILLLVCFVLHLVLFNDAFKNFVPVDDEFPMIVHSTNYARENVDINSWFQRGFRGYFGPYQEWTDRGLTDFIRPVINAVFYINYKLFGENWKSYLLLNYLINSLVIVFVFFMSRKWLRLSLSLSLLASLFFFIISSSGHLYVYPSHIADALLAVWLFAALIACIGQKYKTVIALLILALLTKETAAAVVIVLSIVYLMVVRYNKQRLTKNKIIQAVSISVAPFAFFLLLRILFFKGVAGTYATAGLGSLSESIKNIILGLSYWPSYLGFGRNFLLELSHPKPDYLYLLGVLINFFFVLAALLVVLILIRKLKEFKDPLIYGERAFYQKILLLLALSSSLPLIFLALEKRFAYVFFLFLTPVLMSMMNFKRHKKIYMTIAAGFFLLVASYSSISKIEVPIFSYYLRYTFSEPEQYHQLMKILSGLELEEGERVYLINDRNGIYGAAYLLDFAQKKQTDNLVVLNSVMGWWNYDGKSADVIFSTNSDLVKINVSISRGMLFAFPGSNFETILSHASIRGEDEVSIKRNENISYKIYSSEAVAAVQRFMTVGMNSLERRHWYRSLFGESMTIEIKGGRGKYVYFDFNDRKYKVYSL